ncbi:MAG: decaprenyl-phosphate phosphoribosyltransferase [Chloroflexi bacterium]|nr:decaprenyl-phosphate phosphoribosyltransferase [Chloroflexota bacterium]MYD47405.1 decaprenyl-phosphate phosphoribosyltransferase [Chloroflexota bacterium]
MSLPVALLKTMRPRQWVKNLLVLLPLLFAVDLVWTPSDLTTLLQYASPLAVLFAAFCALSSAVYIINDLADRNADRQHPTKRTRPIASGLLPVPMAAVAQFVLAVAGMFALYAISTPPLVPLALIGAVYLLVNVGYSLGLKRVALVDVMIVAGGYVLRAVAGAVAVGATPSPWLYAVTAAGALFIVIGRRYAEARLAGADPDAQRATLQYYGPPLGGQLLILSATAALVSYTLYAVEADNLPANNTMLLTVPLVIFGLFRYLYLLNHSRDAESPELLMLRDAPLLIAIAAWVILAAAVLVLN